MRIVQKFPEDITTVTGLQKCTANVNEALRLCDGGLAELVLDLRDIPFISPAFIAIISALVARVSAKNDTKLFWNPPGSRQIRQYLANIGFDKHFVETSAQLQPDKAESCYQLRFTSPQVKEIVGIAEFCQRYVVSSSDSFSRIELALSEIMDNVKIHSQSPIGGCMVGQYYSRKKLIKIALCDLGVSIPFHLSQKRPYSDGWNDEQLLAEAFKLGVTGTTERTGLGLFEAAQFTRDLGGRLIVCSRSAVYHIDGHQEETSSISENFPGTIISLHWPTT